MNYCGFCGVPLVKGANFCHMCGVNIMEAEKNTESKQLLGEIPLCRHTIKSSVGDKVVEVWCRDITNFPQTLDLLTLSAYHKNYNIRTKTVIGALYDKNEIDTGIYAEKPFMDLRDFICCWISEPVECTPKNTHIKRIGCIELSGSRTTEDEILMRIQGYFRMLDLAAYAGIKMDTVAIPVIGTGNQRISIDKMLIPLTNEVVSMLKRNPNIHKLLFVERNYEKAKLVADCFKESYQMVHEEKNTKVSKSEREPFVFISYSTHGDTEAARLLCKILDEKGIPHWFAPERINSGEYASQIVSAIDRCTHFICIISQKSMYSHHVLNELNLAYQYIDNGVSILPFFVEKEDLTGAFRYYLSTMQWHYGCPPPLEIKAREFIEKVFE